MRKIDDYINSMYKKVDGNKKEIEELKMEMRSHLIESIEDFKRKGYSENDSVDFALESFGEKNQLVKGLSEFFNLQKQFSKYVLLVALCSLACSIFFFIQSVNETNTINSEIDEFKIEKEETVQQVLNLLDDSTTLTENQTKEIVNIYAGKKEHISKLAVFNVNKNENVKNWLNENLDVKTNATTILPISYKESEFLIVDNEIENNLKDISPSKYDLGTIAKATNEWIVQFEYSANYYSTIEKNNLVLLNGYKYFLPLFYLPLMFFVLFITLIIIWFFQKKSQKLLKIFKASII